MCLQRRKACRSADKERESIFTTTTPSSKAAEREFRPPNFDGFEESAGVGNDLSTDSVWATAIIQKGREDPYTGVSAVSWLAGLGIDEVELDDEKWGIDEDELDEQLGIDAVEHKSIDAVEHEDNCADEHVCDVEDFSWWTAIIQKGKSKTYEAGAVHELTVETSASSGVASSLGTSASAAGYPNPIGF